MHKRQPEAETSRHISEQPRRELRAIGLHWHLVCGTRQFGATELQAVRRIQLFQDLLHLPSSRFALSFWALLRDSRAPLTSHLCPSRVPLATPSPPPRLPLAQNLRPSCVSPISLSRPSLVPLTRLLPPFYVPLAPNPHYSCVTLTSLTRPSRVTFA